MNRLKKFAGLLLALAMVFCLTATAWAEDGTYTIKIKNETPGHIYEAYQIFKGAVSYAVTYTNGDTDTLEYQVKEGEQVGEKTVKEVKRILSSITWGSGVDVEPLIAQDEQTLRSVLGVDDKFDLNNAEKVAERLGDEAANIDAVAFAKLVGKYPNSSAATTDGMPYEMKVEPGYYLIKDQKETLENTENDSYTAYILRVVADVEPSPKPSVPSSEKRIVDGVDGTDPRTCDDYHVGDAIYFRLTATLPSNYDIYETYKLVFHDTMSEGLTFGSIEKITSTTGTATKTLWDKANSLRNGEIDVFAPDDGNTCCSLEVIFEDLKSMDQDAKENTVITVIYSATLNENAVIGNPGNPNPMYLEYSNNPYDKGTGKTPESTAVAFTFELDIDKVDGATVNEDGTAKPGAVIEKLEGVKFKLRNSDGKWLKVDENGFVKEWVDADASELITDEDGLIAIKGLDQGTYYLSEIETNAGYNLMKEEIEAVISATIGEDPSTKEPVVTDLKVNGKDNSGDVATGAGTVVVINNRGIQLPETGGIGTTIFYIVGGVLAVGAVVMLITKRRMRQ